MKITYNELIKEIKKEETANGVQCLLQGIYGENKGHKLWLVWMTGNESHFKELVEFETE